MKWLIAAGLCLSALVAAAVTVQAGARGTEPDPIAVGTHPSDQVRDGWKPACGAR